MPDMRPINIRLKPNQAGHMELAEKIDKYARMDPRAGRGGGAERLMLRGAGMPEPPLVIQADETLLRRIIHEAIREEIAAGGHPEVNTNA